jgi:hypothetical protein
MMDEPMMDEPMMDEPMMDEPMMDEPTRCWLVGEEALDIRCSIGHTHTLFCTSRTSPTVF